MPPQQGDGLLNVFDAALGFRAHGADIGLSQAQVKINLPPAEGFWVLSRSVARSGRRPVSTRDALKDQKTPPQNQGDGVLLLGNGPIEKRSRWPSSADRIRSSSAEYRFRA